MRLFKDCLQHLHEPEDRNSIVSGKRVNVLRSNNGHKFLIKALTNYLIKNGIKHERASRVYLFAYMNGAAEWYNRLFFEGMRTLKLTANIPDKMWTETVMTMNYLKNRVYHSSVDGISFSNWYKKKLSLHGCVVYVFQPKDSRASKFQLKRESSWDMAWKQLVTECGSSKTI